jgi:hypothetical protein
MIPATELAAAEWDGKSGEEVMTCVVSVPNLVNSSWIGGQRPASSQLITAPESLRHCRPGVCCFLRPCCLAVLRKKPFAAGIFLPPCKTTSANM